MIDIVVDVQVFIALLFHKDIENIILTKFNRTLFVTYKSERYLFTHYTTTHNSNLTYSIRIMTDSINFIVTLNFRSNCSNQLVK
jgi:hypothetical protein